MFSSHMLLIHPYLPYQIHEIVPNLSLSSKTLYEANFVKQIQFNSYNWSNYLKNLSIEQNVLPSNDAWQG